MSRTSVDTAPGIRPRPGDDTMQATLILSLADTVAHGGTGAPAGTTAGPLITAWLDGHRGRHGSFSAAAIGMPLGLVRSAVGRRHLAGRRYAAGFARAPEAMGRMIRLIVAGAVARAVAGAVIATVLPTSGHTVSQPAHLGVNGATAVAAGPARTAAAPRLRRTMHPVH
ncbi:hypothetical protein [Streptomyces resistomycificus]|uniref:Uncharacterized protein n=1 Tax=Streptomyces resistomycificus TaxID=67356 RepID=A0A0L8KRE6_9ACTN|nr:hypothetical protein [Streptomyces resistomycificus]KOG28450.1 hypothetical protein ADK37_39150 [Streptomyces resistomycificus]KUN91270.1 hypothetical protein AQJ84_37425 [Streptomyces resistomycificus]